MKCYESDSYAHPQTLPNCSNLLLYRLLDMGFEKEVSQIMTHIRQHSSNSKQQTVLLSATLSNDVKRLASVTLNDPVTVDISASDSNKVIKLH